MKSVEKWRLHSLMLQNARLMSMKISVFLENHAIEIISQFFVFLNTRVDYFLIVWYNYTKFVK